MPAHISASSASISLRLCTSKANLLGISNLFQNHLTIGIRIRAIAKPIPIIWNRPIAIFSPHNISVSMNFSTHQVFPTFRVFAQFDYKFIRATRQHRDVDFSTFWNISEQRAFNQFVIECNETNSNYSPE